MMKIHIKKNKFMVIGLLIAAVSFAFAVNLITGKNEVYIYTTDKSEELVVDWGIPDRRETLSSLIANSKFDVKVGINCGLFDMLDTGGIQHYGTLMINGEYLRQPIPQFIDLIYYKDGHTEIRTIKDEEECNKLKETTKWVIGTSYALIIEGKIDLRNAEQFPDSTCGYSRTLLGQKKDGTWVLIVVDGTKSIRRGMTAEEEAKLMLKQGCYNAVNLDGDGSSEMIINEKIINHPSDGKERPMGSAIFVVDKSKINE